VSGVTTFNQEIADEICAQLSDGKSMRTICRDESMPAMSTVFKWLREQPAFSEQYARAKEETADALTEDMLEIADNLSEEAQSRRVRIDTRKWIASKLKPKKYGEKLELAGDPKAPIGITVTAHEKDERV
jgi:hypothetical protein